MAAPPQEAEEAYDLIQEVEWNRELSNTITLIGHLGCVHVGQMSQREMALTSSSVQQFDGRALCAHPKCKTTLSLS